MFPHTRPGHQTRPGHSTHGQDTPHMASVTREAINQAGTTGTIRQEVFTFLETLPRPCVTRGNEILVVKIDTILVREETIKEDRGALHPGHIQSLACRRLGFFTYYTVAMGEINPSGPVPIDSVFIYRPDKRLEIWRFLFYMVLHAGGIGLRGNVSELASKEKLFNTFYTPGRFSNRELPVVSSVFCETVALDHPTTEADQWLLLKWRRLLVRYLTVETKMIQSVCRVILNSRVYQVKSVCKSCSDTLTRRRESPPVGSTLHSPRREGGAGKHPSGDQKQTPWIYTTRRAQQEPGLGGDKG
uniref:Uncharacterized protein n=1 Tax=Timema monikensis TaxID=170555 RepID=A0A7R9EHI4_9NEOP|nr:unnamed protein product [Timema monikensis]